MKKYNSILGQHSPLENMLCQIISNLFVRYPNLEVHMSVIKKLVSNNFGITFLFEVVAKQEIENVILDVIHLPNFNEQREFNFVMLKNSLYKPRMLSFYSILKNELNHLKK